MGHTGGREAVEGRDSSPRCVRAVVAVGYRDGHENGERRDGNYSAPSGQPAKPKTAPKHDYTEDPF